MILLSLKSLIDEQRENELHPSKMDQQLLHSEKDLPGLSSCRFDDNSGVKFSREIMWSNAAFQSTNEINNVKDPLEAKIPKKCNLGVSLMSNEELKIRCQLGIDVEKDLEEEIKEGICHLALRLHRLYQHQKDRIVGDLPTGSADFKSETKTPVFTEVNLMVRMEGGSRMEIVDGKKGIRDVGSARESGLEEKSFRNGIKLNANQIKSCSTSKEFDWVMTVSSGTSSDGYGKKNQPNPKSKPNYLSPTASSQNSKKKQLESPSNLRKANRKLWNA